MKRYRKVMGLAIVLVALAVAINALAFKTATVTNTASFTVSATGSAALAIEAAPSPGTGFDTAGQFTSNYMTLTINDQMQPNSVYVFDNVFQITNKASNTTTSITNINYNKAALDQMATNGWKVRLLDSSDGTELNNESLATTLSVVVDVEVTVGTSATLTAKSFNIVITGDQ